MPKGRVWGLGVSDYDVGRGNTGVKVRKFYERGPGREVCWTAGVVRRATEKLMDGEDMGSKVTVLTTRRGKAGYTRREPTLYAIWELMPTKCVF